MRFQSHASGLFAFDKTIKVSKGQYCGLRRNEYNFHGRKHRPDDVSDISLMRHISTIHSAPALYIFYRCKLHPTACT